MKVPERNIRTLKAILILRSTVLNLWVDTPLGVAYLISYISDIYIAIYSNYKIKVMNLQGNNYIHGWGSPYHEDLYLKCGLRW